MNEKEEKIRRILEIEISAHCKIPKEDLKRYMSESEAEEYERLVEEI